MKTEDIDKKIGMPDVDKEWARFEQEVISKGTRKSPALAWALGIGIAASIILVAGFFFFNQDVKESKQILAEMKEKTVSHEAVSMPSDSLAKLIATTSQKSKRVNTATEIDRKEDNIYDCDEENAVFPGGDDALMTFIKANIRYPHLALEYGARGMVWMSCIIDSVGEVSDIKISRYHRMSYDTLYLSRKPENMQVKIKEQIALQLGEESARILNLMPRWSPGRINGKSVNMRWMIPVKFNATEAERQMFLAKNENAKADSFEDLAKPAPKSLQDQIAGLDIVPNSSYLGLSSGTTMRLIGTTTHKDKKQPLIVMNDRIIEVPDSVNFDNLDTEEQFANLLGIKSKDIKSIAVLKDDASTAKWGEKGAAGVITITTKRSLALKDEDKPLQGEIAGREAIDPNYNDSILVMLDGIRLPDSLCTRHFIRHGGIHSYLKKKGLKVDKIIHLSDESISMNENEKAKQRYLQYIEMYGRLAELGVAEITTCNDSLNEVFILQHPELMKTHRRVEGYVFDDETNKAIEYAMINYIHKGKYKGFVASDSLGHFVLWVPQFADTLKATHVGYQDAIFQPADTTIVIRLKDKIIKDLKRDIKF